jgi:hypothetical protein
LRYLFGGGFRTSKTFSFCEQKIFGTGEITPCGRDLFGGVDSEHPKPSAFVNKRFLEVERLLPAVVISLGGWIQNIQNLQLLLAKAGFFNSK